MSQKAKNLIERGIKIVCILLCCLFFVPAFTASCSGESVDVSPVHSVVGYYGQNGFSGEREIISNPAPWCLLLLVIPLGIFISWLILSEEKRKAFVLYAISGSGVVFDFLMWHEFKSKVYSIAEEWYADVTPQFGYKYTMVLLVVLTILIATHALTGIVSNATNVHKTEVSDNASECMNKDSKPEISSRYVNN